MDELEGIEPNKALERTCENLFYKGGDEFKGKVGTKVLGSIMGADREQFEEYIDSLKDEQSFENDEQTM